MRLTPALAFALMGNLYAGPSPVVVPSTSTGSEAAWALGLESMALRPFQGEGMSRDNDFDFGGRVLLGYQFDDGLFTRLTYFGYVGDGELTAVDDVTCDFEISCWDLVVGDTFHPTEKLTMVASAGLRQVHVEDRMEGGVFNDFVRTEFAGLGVVAGLDVQRKLTERLSFYLTAKQAVVFGDTNFDSSFFSDHSFVEQENTLFITELGGGIQYDFAIGTVNSNIRVGVEGQYLANPCLNVGGPAFSRTSAGIAGFVLGVNCQF